ncbi:UNVERIFIED_CONTAM: hypothetical protein FKN15_039718 [Acipenser sinensis]
MALPIGALKLPVCWLTLRLSARNVNGFNFKIIQHGNPDYSDNHKGTVRINLKIDQSRWSFFSHCDDKFVSNIGYEPNKTDIILTKDIVGTLKQGSNVVLRKKGKEKDTFPVKMMKLRGKCHCTAFFAATADCISPLQQRTHIVPVHLAKNFILKKLVLQNEKQWRSINSLKRQIVHLHKQSDLLPKLRENSLNACRVTMRMNHWREHGCAKQYQKSVLHTLGMTVQEDSVHFTQDPYLPLYWTPCKTRYYAVPPFCQTL